MRKLARFLPSLAFAACNGPASPPPAVNASAAPPAVDAAAPPATASAGTNAPVVVAIVVDQLASWVAAERWPELPNAGGFAKLRAEGTWAKKLTYLHATTETAPGHAALFTGKTPHETGIVGNKVWRADLKPARPASLLDNDETTLVGSKGPLEKPKGISLAKLRVPTIADKLLEKDPRAVVVALSMKDRGAAFGAGKTPTASLWFDDDSASFVTSTPGSFPAWAVPHDVVRQDITWTLRFGDFVKAHAGKVPDPQRGETPDVCGSVKFDHRTACADGEKSQGCWSKFFKATPMADARLVDLAISAVKAERKREHPMLLAISFSANDYVGHAYGPNSYEAWEQLAELDATLARLFAELDAMVGHDGYSVVLSGDHGIVPYPDPPEGADKAPWCAKGAANPYEKPCASPQRLYPDAIKKLLNDDPEIKALVEGTEPVVKAVVEGLVFLSPPAHAKSAALHALVRKKLLASRADGVAGIADVLTIAELRDCPPPSDESVPALVCRATVPELGDYYIVPKRGNYVSAEPECQAPAHKLEWRARVDHGTPYLYDRTVPLIVRYPGGAGGQSIEEPRLFGSYYASVWYALTGEIVEGTYGGPIGVPPKAPSR